MLRTCPHCSGQVQRGMSLKLVKMTILLFVDHQIDPAREIELLTRISAHLSFRDHTL
jgi:hypothetical protein